MRDENDEPIYTYIDKYKRWFVRQSIRGGRVRSCNHYYRSKICDEVSKNPIRRIKCKKTCV